MAHPRFTASISTSSPALQVWAVRSAVALGVDAVRTFCPLSQEAQDAAAATRMPLLVDAATAPSSSFFPSGSLPSPGYLRTLLPPSECNLCSHAFEQAFASWAPEDSVLSPIDLYAASLRRYRVPSRFEHEILLTQLRQAEEAVSIVENARFGAFQADRLDLSELQIPLLLEDRGTLFSLLDPDGGWRIAQRWLHETLRPSTIAPRWDSEKALLTLWVSTRRAEPLHAWTHWRVVRTDGMLLDEGGRSFDLDGNSCRAVETLSLAGLLREYPSSEILVWASLETDDGRILSRRLLPFCPPKHLSLVDPELSIEVESIPARSAKGSPEWRQQFRMLFPEHNDELETRRSGGHWFRITLTSLAPTLSIHLSTPGLSGIHFGENAFPLETESPREILARSARPLTQKAFRSALRVETLTDFSRELQ